MIVALGALSVALRDGARAERLLDLTGLSADQLRERAGDPALLAAALSSSKRTSRTSWQ